MSDLDAIRAQKLYFVLCDYQNSGLAFLETDPHEDLLGKLVEEQKGPYPNHILKIIEVDLISKSVRDYSEEAVKKYPGLSIGAPRTPSNAALLKATENNDLFFTLNDFGKYGIAFLEMDPQRDNRCEILKMLNSHEVEDPLMVIKANLKQGRAYDISSDMAKQWFDMMFEDHADSVAADEKHIDDIPAFILRNHPEKDGVTRHFTPPRPETR